MTMQRLPIVLCFLAACGDDPAWRDVGPAETSDVTFQAVTGRGEEVQVYGVHANGDPALVRFDSVSWSAADASPLARPWLSDDGDLWGILSGGLVRDDEEIDLASVLGNAYVVTAVWGTTSSDVYAIADLMPSGGQDRTLIHFDGDAWTIDDAWRDLFGTDKEEGVVLQSGCSLGDETWIAGYSYFGIGTFGELLHWDGATWTKAVTSFGEEGASIAALACRDGMAWATGTGTSGSPMRVEVSAGSTWSEIALSGDVMDQPVALAAGDDEAWVIATEIWRVDQDRAGTVPVADERALTAAWVTASGRVFVFGVDGLILEHL